MTKIRIYMMNNNRDIITTKKPKWLFLTMLQLDRGLYYNNRFVPITAIQQIDFEKE